MGGSLLCAAAPATVMPRAGIAFAAAGEAAPPAANSTADVAPVADGAPAPAPGPSGSAPGPAAVTAPIDPVSQPAAAPTDAGATPTTEAPAAPPSGGPAATPQSGPSGGPAAFWPVAPEGSPSSAPTRAPHDEALASTSACLRVDTTRSCALPQRDTNGRRGADGTDSAASEPQVEVAAAQAAPAVTLSGLPPARIPNFFIDRFQIPPFLLSIYQAAGIQYGIRWEVLAAINEIETDYGRNLNVSSAGAMGWMQFIPSSWKTWAVDANSDGRKDPYNPVDAIFAAARYLKAAGADQDLRKAIYAYNHADWYVDSVLMRARLIGGIPEDLVSALTGLSQGRLPVAARARYGSDAATRAARGIDIFAAPGAPAVSVQDGEIIRVGHSKRLGRFVVLRDAYGNTYTYARLKTVAEQVPVPKPMRQSAASIAKQLALPAPDPAPTAPATVGPGNRRHAPDTGAGAAPAPAPAPAASPAPAAAPAPAAVPAPAPAAAKERLFAHPGRPRALRAGGRAQILESWAPLPGSASLRSYLTGSYALERGDVVLKRLVPGRKVIAGTILGRIGTNPSARPPHMRFEIRPAGRGAPRVDPRPMVRGWRLLDSTAIDRAHGGNALAGELAGPTLGQLLLMSKDALTQRVLADPGIEIYACGRRDIQAGIVDRRVLATLAFLAASGFKPTVTSLHCGHGFYTAAGNVSAHSSGAAVDIAKINGIPILGNQGPGSIADLTIRRLLTLQGALQPAQIISLMSYEGTANTLALADHADHIHVGFRAQTRPLTDGRPAPGALRPSQWTRLIDRLGSIADPAVRLRPSRYAIKAAPASRSP
ncbi:MAG: hypothetical protein QOI48_3467 [Solirubrobacteraceae bacterium]|nr:hypothetical protein [Solirubrobacteraceae bacterium]